MNNQKLKDMNTFVRNHLTHRIKGFLTFSIQKGVGIVYYVMPREKNFRAYLDNCPRSNWKNIIIDRLLDTMTNYYCEHWDEFVRLEPLL